MRHFNIIGHKGIFLAISGILVVAAVAALVLWGLTPGIDFVGGTSWQIKAGTFAGTTRLTKAALTEFTSQELRLRDAVILEQSDGSFIVRAKEITEEEHQKNLVRLREKFGGEELRFETIGAAVGQELRSKALTVFLLVLVGISLYVTF